MHAEFSCLCGKPCAGQSMLRRFAPHRQTLRPAPQDVHRPRTVGHDAQSPRKATMLRSPAQAHILHRKPASLRREKPSPKEAVLDASCFLYRQGHALPCLRRPAKSAARRLLHAERCAVTCTRRPCCCRISQQRAAPKRLVRGAPLMPHVGRKTPVCFSAGACVHLGPLPLADGRHRLKAACPPCPTQVPPPSKPKRPKLHAERRSSRKKTTRGEHSRLFPAHRAKPFSLSPKTTKGMPLSGHPFLLCLSA